ncbi:armadillo repeat-containing protein 3 [Holotrichia oblita]|uniref:Armadillo repeat-containing protein 3 n=1 Tax=Holotrichia oblita TaxID=644536 RepID=A0ACB9TRL6_HOLOL|nr:armadillo repeat-containing protein 3 [Holotrichia oblita]
MPPKKKNTVAEKKPEIPFEPVVYVTNKVSTMIDLLDSPEENVLLRTVATLNKIAINRDDNLYFMLSCKIYEKLLRLLSSEEIYTIRFTLALVEKVVTKPDLIVRVSMKQLISTAELVAIKYLNLRDDIVRSSSSNILLHLSKHHTMVTEYVYSVKLLSKIFEIVTTTKEFELAFNNLQLLFYVLDSPKAEKEFLTCQDFSIAYLLCLFESKHELMRSWAIKILHKIIMWKKEDILSHLGENRIVPNLMKLILKESDIDYRESCFQAIYACLTVKECVQNLVKSLEFVEFLQWVKTCPKILVGSSSLILKTLSEHEDLLQVLFDFSAEESAICLFRYINEAVILNVCDLILNMMRHKYCLESMAKPSLFRTLIEIIHNNKTFPIVPYGEKALETLHRFFVLYDKTMSLVFESKSVNMLKDIFEKSYSKFTRTGYLKMIEIMQFILRSQYAHALIDIGIIQLVIDLYFESSFEEEMILTVMESFFDNEEFREIFLERKGLDVFMDKILNRKSIESSAQILMAIKKLLVYKKFGQALIDGGYVAQLRFFKDNLKFYTPILDEILEAIYDFSLTLKFFYKKRLDENDKIRDNFLLIPDAINSLPLSCFNVESKKLSDRIPIYVVTLQELQSTHKSNRVKSIMEINESDRRVFSGIRRIAKNEDEINPFHRLVRDDVKGFKASDDSFHVLIKPEVYTEDPSLHKVIASLYEEIHETHPIAYEEIHLRVKVIGMTVNHYLSNWYICQKHHNHKHALEHHIRGLIKKYETNFIPIGNLKLGYQCERALMFKVICDQTKVPTTLCKKDDSYFNEISVFGNNTDLRRGPLVQKRFIVDLMEQIGDLIPQGSREADAYLKKYRTQF